MASMWTLERGAQGQLKQATASCPSCSDGHALVRIVAAGLDGGAWRDLADGKATLDRALTEPLSPSLVGVVQAVHGEQSSLVGQAVAIVPVVACGTCPACLRGDSLACHSAIRAGFRPPRVLAEMLAVPVSNIVPLVPGRRREEATLVGTAAGVLRAVRQARVSIGESVAVFGTGLEMVLASQWVRVAGAYDVYVVGQDPAGLALARKLWLGERIDGSSGQVPEQILATHAGQGVDLAIVTVGDTHGLEMARKTIATDRRILILETSDDRFPHGAQPASAQVEGVDQSEIRCACLSWSRGDWEIAARTWGSGRLALRDLISETLSVRELVQCINQKDTGAGRYLVAIPD